MRADPYGPYRLRIRNVITSAPVAESSSMSPISRRRFGISMAASESVHSITSTSPEFTIEARVVPGPMHAGSQQTGLVAGYLDENVTVG